MILAEWDGLIARLLGLDLARDWLPDARGEDPLAVSVVSIAELIGGMRSAELRGPWQLLASFRAEPVTEISVGTGPSSTSAVPKGSPR